MFNAVGSKSNSDSKIKYILPWFICSVAAIFYCYEFFLRVAPGVMSSDMMRFYKIGAGEFGVLTAFYSYAYTPMQLFVGLLMDHYGPRKLLCVSILTCVFGCFLFPFFSQLYFGKLALFAIGFGSAFAFVGVLKLAVNWLPPSRLSLVAGSVTALGLLGGVLAEELLSNVVSNLNWRDAWYYAGIIGIAIYVITLFLVKDHPTERLPKVDDITEASWRTLFYDLMCMLKNYKFLINGLIGCVLYLPISVFGGLWAVRFFEQAGQLSHSTTTHIVPLIFIGMAIGGPLASVISEYFGCRKILYQISLVSSFFVFLTIIYFPTLPVYVLGSLLFMLGLLAGSEILVFVVGVELTSKEVAGTATAGTNFLVMISLIILSPIIGNLLEYHWDGAIVDGVPFYNLSSYHFALLLLPICYIVVFLLSFLLPDTHPKARVKKLAEDQELLSINNN